MSIIETPMDYNNNEDTELCEIMYKYGSDKTPYKKWHNYTKTYSLLFNNFRTKQNINIFELGIGSQDNNIKSYMDSSYKIGGSLYGWREYFNYANIYGADIDKKSIFRDNRINTFYCDQTNKTCVEELWNYEEIKDIKFDIIIDDGLHEFDANLCFLENSIHKLNNNGYFIIEDIVIGEYLDKWIKILPILKEKYNYLTFTLLKLNFIYNNLDNNILVIYKA